jgi:hypothetical protein
MGRDTLLDQFLDIINRGALQLFVWVAVFLLFAGPALFCLRETLRRWSLRSFAACAILGALAVVWFVFGHLVLVQVF